MGQVLAKPLQKTFMKIDLVKEVLYSLNLDTEKIAQEIIDKHLTPQKAK